MSPGEGHSASEPPTLSSAVPPPDALRSRNGTQGEEGQAGGGRKVYSICRVRGRCIEGTVGHVPLGDVCQCLQTSAVFTCLPSTALTALVELVDFSYIQVTQPFSLPNRYRGVRNWYNSWFSWSAGEIIPVETRKSHF